MITPEVVATLRRPVSMQVWCKKCRRRTARGEGAWAQYLLVRDVASGLYDMGHVVQFYCDQCVDPNVTVVSAGDASALVNLLNAGGGGD